MGLREDIQRSVTSGMRGLGNLNTTFTFVQVTPGSYNTSTGVFTSSESTVSVSGVLTRFNSGETNDLNLLRTGQKALIPSSEFVNVNPDALEDKVEVNNKRYKIDNFRLDPAGALYIFALIAMED